MSGLRRCGFWISLWCCFMWGMQSIFQAYHSRLVWEKLYFHDYGDICLTWDTFVTFILYFVWWWWHQVTSSISVQHRMTVRSTKGGVKHVRRVDFKSVSGWECWKRVSDWIGSGVADRSIDAHQNPSGPRLEDINPHQTPSSPSVLLSRVCVSHTLFTFTSTHFFTQHTFTYSLGIKVPNEYSCDDDPLFSLFSFFFHVI